MKRILIIASVALASSFALASPSIGDRAEFAITISQGQDVAHGTLTEEITQYDQAKDQYLVVYTEASANGKQPKVEQSWTDTKNFATQDVMKDIVTNCTTKGGQAETLTVNGQPLDTCYGPTAKGTVWLANVPFRYAKMNGTEADGTKFELVLTSYKFGQ